VVEINGGGVFSALADMSAAGLRLDADIVPRIARHLGILDSLYMVGLVRS